MDLETKARGVTVNIAISGTMQKLNVNYSSDPPMQPQEIIALLAVGRAPTDSAGLNVTQSNSSSTSLVEAGGGLIGQAISAQLSSRLQRFFGASRVKIDPTLDRRRLSAASAPDHRAASVERHYADLHHQSESHAGADRAGRMGFQPAVVGHRGTRGEWAVRDRFPIPEKIQVSSAAAEWWRSNCAAAAFATRAYSTAMLRIPREEFVPAEFRDHAYSDAPLPIGHGQTITQPYMTAVMAELTRADGHGEGAGRRRRLGLSRGGAGGAGAARDLDRTDSGAGGARPRESSAHRARFEYHGDLRRRIAGGSRRESV